MTGTLGTLGSVSGGSDGSASPNGGTLGMWNEPSDGMPGIDGTSGSAYGGNDTIANANAGIVILQPIAQGEALSFELCPCVASCARSVCNAVTAGAIVGSGARMFTADASVDTSAKSCVSNWKRSV
jgi:hypothetical protein